MSSSVSYGNVDLDMGCAYGACAWGAAGVGPAGAAVPLERLSGASRRVGRVGWGGPGGAGVPTWTYFSDVDVFFSRSSGGGAQKDGRRVRSCWEGTLTFRCGAGPAGSGGRACWCGAGRPDDWLTDFAAGRERWSFHALLSRPPVSGMVEVGVIPWPGGADREARPGRRGPEGAGGEGAGGDHFAGRSCAPPGRRAGPTSGRRIRPVSARDPGTAPGLRGAEQPVGRPAGRVSLAAPPWESLV